MASVWYLGTGFIRRITSYDWLALGVANVAQSQWDSSNGYSIPVTSFTSEQILILSEMEEFDADAPNGPRNPSAVDVPDVFPKYLPRGGIDGDTLVRDGKGLKFSSPGGPEQIEAVTTRVLAELEPPVPYSQLYMNAKV